MLNNIKKSAVFYKNRVPVNIDGTFSLEKEGKILLAVGSHSINFNNKSKNYHHNFRPFIYCLISEESGFIVQKVLEKLNQIAIEYLGLVEFQMDCIISDHSLGIRSGIKQFSKDFIDSVNHVTCYTHVIRFYIY